MEKNLEVISEAFTIAVFEKISQKLLDNLINKEMNNFISLELLVSEQLKLDENDIVLTEKANKFFDEILELIIDYLVEIELKAHFSCKLKEKKS